jgi:hypothetical protein
MNIQDIQFMSLTHLENGKKEVAQVRDLFEGLL